MDFDHALANYLNDDGIKAIQQLEKETGKQIMAYYAPPAAANLGDQDLAKLKELERKLCVRLVAYKSH
ncbi:MAG: hypothetical protein ACN4GW_05480 [Desulforhopalus sp.]